MRFLLSKTGIATILLLGVFVFGYLVIGGVFGNTQIGLTLKSNADLENGLVTHVTFDGEYEQGTYEFGTDGATTTDLTGNQEVPYDTTSDESHLYIVGAGISNSTNFGQMLMLKVEPVTGDLVWASTTDWTSDEDVLFGATFFNDYLYATGYCSGCGSKGGDAYQTMKIDPSNGDLIWATTTDPTSSDDVAWEIAALDDGIFVVGECDGCGHLGGKAGYMIKIDPSDGDMLWATTTDPTSNDDVAKGVATDGTSLFVAGKCQGCRGGSGLGKFYVYAVDPSSGGMLWATTTDPTSLNDNLEDVEYKDGYLYAGGGCSSATGCAGPSAEQLYAAKFSAIDGQFIWGTSTYSGSVVNRGYDITLDDSNVYFMGTCFGTCQKGNNGGGTDFLVAIDQSDGDFLWSTSTDATSNGDTGESVYVFEDELYSVHACNGCGGRGGDAVHIVNIDKTTGDLGRTTTSADAVVAIGGAEIGPGNIGQGAEFDGVDDYVVVAQGASNTFGDSSSDSSFSVAAWVYMNDATGFPVYSKADSSTDLEWEFKGFTDDTLMLNLHDNDNSNYILRQSSNTITGYENEWVHVAATYDGGGSDTGIALYVNGESVATTPDTGGSYTAMHDEDTDLHIGGAPAVGAYADGEIDDARIYSRELSASEITRLYELGATTHIGTSINTNSELNEGLVGHWTLDSVDVVTGSTTDRGSGGNEGVLDRGTEPGSALVIEATDATQDGSNSTSASLAVTLPSYSSGDLVIIALDVWSNGASKTVTWPSGPDGETIGDVTNTSGSGTSNTAYIAIGRYIATDAYAGGDITVTASASTRWAGAVVVVPAGEFDPTTPIPDIQGEDNSETDESTLNFASFDAGVEDENGKLLVFLASDQDPISATQPTGWTMLENLDQGRASMQLAVRDAAVSKSETITPPAGGWSITSDAWAAYAFIVRTAPGPAEPLKTSMRPGKIGQGLWFDGEDDEVFGVTPLPWNPPNGFSMFSWFKIDGSVLSGDNIPFEARSSAQFYLESTAGGNLRCVINGNDVDTPTPTYSIRADEWIHAGCVYSTTTKALTLYVNGASSTSAYADEFGGFFDNGDFLSIGRSQSGTSFKGHVDDVRIYDQEIPAAKVQRLYEQGATTHISTTNTVSDGLNTGLVGHWTFDGKDMDISSTTGEVHEVAGRAPAGDWQNHATTTRPGRLGQALYFDGTDDLINFGDVANLGTDDMAVSVWIKMPVDQDVLPGIMAKGASGTTDEGWALNYQVATDAFGFTVSDGTTRIFPQASIEINDNRWHHIIVNVDRDTNVEFYLDNENAGTYGNPVYNGTDVSDSAEDFRIGIWTDREYAGLIDDVRIYNRLLTDAERERLYQLGQ